MRSSERRKVSEVFEKFSGSVTNGEIEMMEVRRRARIERELGSRWSSEY